MTRPDVWATEHLPRCSRPHNPNPSASTPLGDGPLEHQATSAHVQIHTDNHLANRQGPAQPGGTVPQHRGRGVHTYRAEQNGEKSGAVFRRRGCVNSLGNNFRGAFLTAIFRHHFFPGGATGGRRFPCPVSDESGAVGRLDLSCAGFDHVPAPLASCRYGQRPFLDTLCSSLPLPSCPSSASVLRSSAHLPLHVVSPFLSMVLSPAPARPIRAPTARALRSPSFMKTSSEQ